MPTPRSDCAKGSLRRSGSGKTATLRAVATHAGSQVVNLNLELSRRLLDLTQSRGALKVPGALDEILGRDRPLVLRDNTEILFDRRYGRIPPPVRSRQPAATEATEANGLLSDLDTGAAAG